MVAPIAGAKSGGVTGCAKGLGLGFIGGTLAVIGGLGTGVWQMTRGVVNTPGAIKASQFDGKVLLWRGPEVRGRGLLVQGGSRRPPRAEVPSADRGCRQSGAEAQGRRVQCMFFFGGQVSIPLATSPSALQTMCSSEAPRKMFLRPGKRTLWGCTVRCAKLCKK